MPNNNNNGGFVSNTISWFQHPFQTQGSALNWWLFVGLILIAAWMWTRILDKINQGL